MARIKIPPFDFNAHHQMAFDIATQVRKQGWQPARSVSDARVVHYDAHPHIQTREYHTAISRSDPYAAAQLETWVRPISKNIRPLELLQAQLPGSIPRPLDPPRRSAPARAMTQQLPPDALRLISQLQKRIDDLEQLTDTRQRPTRTPTRPTQDGTPARRVNIPRVNPDINAAAAIQRLKTYVNPLTPAGYKNRPASDNQAAAIRALTAENARNAANPKPRIATRPATTKPTTTRPATTTTRELPLGPSQKKTTTPLKPTKPIARAPGNAQGAKPPRLGLAPIKSTNPITSLKPTGPTPNLYPNATTKPTYKKPLQTIGKPLPKPPATTKPKAPPKPPAAAKPKAPPKPPAPKKPTQPKPTPPKPPKPQNKQPGPDAEDKPPIDDDQLQDPDKEVQDALYGDDEKDVYEAASEALAAMLANGDIDEGQYRSAMDALGDALDDFESSDQTDSDADAYQSTVIDLTDYYLALNNPNAPDGSMTSGDPYAQPEPDATRDNQRQPTTQPTTEGINAYTDPRTGITYLSGGLSGPDPNIPEYDPGDGTIDEPDPDYIEEDPDIIEDDTITIDEYDPADYEDDSNDGNDDGEDYGDDEGNDGDDGDQGDYG